MKCSSCNTEWPANVKFCVKCGSQLNVSAGLGLDSPGRSAQEIRGNDSELARPATFARYIGKETRINKE